MTVALTWPSDLRWSDTAADPIARTTSGGPSFDGTEQVVARDGGIWRIRLNGIRVRRASEIRAFRGLILGLEGRANTVLVPLCEKARSPRPGGAWTRWPQFKGTGYEYSRESPRTTTALPDRGAMAAANAGIRDTSLSVVMTHDLVPEVGMLFSVGSSLCGIKNVASVGGQTYTLGIRPPLRAAVSSGDAVEFDNPMLECRLTSDDQSLLLNLNRFSSPSLEFIEAR